MAHTRREFLKTAAAGAAATGTLGFPMVSRAQQKKLTVWWNRGYYKRKRTRRC
jgi:anaerobic selenocysteine-containing dehydrogenase